MEKDVVTLNEFLEERKVNNDCSGIKVMFSQNMFYLDYSRY